jgi:hypothetical protein
MSISKNNLLLRLQKRLFQKSGVKCKQDKWRCVQISIGPKTGERELGTGVVESVGSNLLQTLYCKFSGLYIFYRIANSTPQHLHVRGCILFSRLHFSSFPVQGDSIRMTFGLEKKNEFIYRLHITWLLRVVNERLTALYAYRNIAARSSSNRTFLTSVWFAVTL